MSKIQFLVITENQRHEYHEDNTHNWEIGQIMVVDGAERELGTTVKPKKWGAEYELFNTILEALAYSISIMPIGELEKFTVGTTTIYKNREAYKDQQMKEYRARYTRKK